MPAGLMCWDQAGVNTVNVTDNLCRAYGQFVTSGPNGTFQLPAGRPWFSVYIFNSFDGPYLPQFWITAGNVLNWSTATSGERALVTYGVY